MLVLWKSQVIWQLQYTMKHFQGSIHFLLLSRFTNNDHIGKWLCLTYNQVTKCKPNQSRYGSFPTGYVVSSERSDPILWYFMMNNYNYEYENLVFWKQKGPAHKQQLLPYAWSLSPPFSGKLKRSAHKFHIQLWSIWSLVCWTYPPVTKAVQICKRIAQWLGKQTQRWERQPCFESITVLLVL